MGFIGSISSWPGLNFLMLPAFPVTGLGGGSTFGLIMNSSLFGSVLKAFLGLLTVFKTAWNNFKCVRTLVELEHLNTWQTPQVKRGGP